MSNSYYQFSRFVVRQERCAMKVGTDGTLLGAWANGGGRVLDVGCGTGLIALMMAQRFPLCQATAIDIDHEACQQACENIAASPFAQRINVVESSVQQFAETIVGDGGPLFDAIVCNPPFFSQSLKSPDDRRSLARHDTSLPFGELFVSVARLLHPQGRFSLVIPSRSAGEIHTEAVMAGLFLTRECRVKTASHKPPSRCLLEFSWQPEPSFEVEELTIGDDRHRQLLAAFTCRNRDE